MSFPRYLVLIAALMVVGYTASPAVVSQSSATQTPSVQPTNQPLELGKAVERSIFGGQSHSFLIDAKGNHFLNLVVAQQGIDVVLALYEPDGTKLGEVDDTERFGPETVIGIMGPAGQYRLEVRPAVENSSAGKYQILLKDLRPVQEEDKALILARRAASEAGAEGSELQDKGDPTSLNAAAEKFRNASTLWRQVHDQYCSWPASSGPRSKQTLL
jgi:hypothetical protein